MRRLTDARLLAAFMRRLGEQPHGGRVYFTGGATAVLLGWRSSTIDIDLKLDADSEPLLQVIPALKEELKVNVELASPDDFIPELPGWRERSLFIVREGSVDFYHYDLYSQALAKLERAHVTDLADVREMIRRGLIQVDAALDLFHRIEPQLYRYPAIDPPTFRRRVEKVLKEG